MHALLHRQPFPVMSESHATPGSASAAAPVHPAAAGSAAVTTDTAKLRGAGELYHEETRKRGIGKAEEVPDYVFDDEEGVQKRGLKFWMRFSLLTLGFGLPIAAVGLLVELVIAPVLGPPLRRLLGPIAPIFRKETLHESRKVRNYWLRAGYILTVFGLMVLAYRDTFFAEEAVLREMVFNDAFEQLVLDLYLFISIAQILLALLVTPVLVAGAFVAEKRNGTLELLSLSSLKDRDIIVGKVLSKYLQMAVLIFSGLPVLGLIKIFGAIDTFLIIGNFTCALSVMLVSGGIAALYGLTARGIVPAIGWSYLMLVLVYGVASGLLVAVFSFIFANNGKEVGQAIAYAINPPYAQVLLLEIRSQQDGMNDLWFVIASCAQLLVAGLVAMFYVRMAEKQYRWWALGLSPLPQDWSASRPASTASAGFKVAALAEQRSDTRQLDPMALREQAEKRQGRLSRLRIGTIVAVAILELLAILIGLANEKLILHQAFVSLQLLALIMAVGVQAAAAFAQEKENRTLDVLLTTPLSTGEILWSKVRGLVDLIWIPALVMLGHTILFASIGHLDLISVPLMAMTLLIFLPLILVIGLIISVRGTTAGKAVVSMVVTVLGVSLGTLMIGYLIESYVPDLQEVGAFIKALNPLQQVWDSLQAGAQMDKSQQGDYPITSFIALMFAALALISLSSTLALRFNDWIRESFN